LGHAGAHPLTYLNRSPLASSGSLPAVITKAYAAPVALDVIASSSPVVQSTLHSVVDTTLPTSTPFPVSASTSHGINDSPSLTSTLRSPVSFGGDTPANSADVLDVIAPPSPVVQSTLHSVVDTTLPASTPFPVSASTSHGINDSPSLTSTLRSPVSFGGDTPANSADVLDVIAPPSPVVQSTRHTVVDDTLLASTPFPVPSSTSPGIDDGPPLISSPQIGQSPPVSFGGDAPANSADSGFSDVLDVVSPAIPTPTGGQRQGITAATIGGPVDTSIPNGETIGPVPLTSALPPGEIEISTITTPATTAIATTDFTSIPPSVISGYVVPFALSLHTADDRMSSVSQIDLFANHPPFDHDDGDKFRRTSLFTTTTEVVFYSSTEISGTPTSILKTETTKTVLPTVVPNHFHRSPSRLATPNSGLVQLDDGMPLTVLF
jgi:hypothetical protein